MSRSYRSLDVHELWARRYLAWLLFWREVQVRYRQSLLGFSWAIIRPLAMMVVFTYLFGSVADLPSQDIPYPLYVFSAVLCWDLFANTVTGCASSLISNRAIVDRIYCPRLIMPISSIFSALFDFLIAFVVFLVLLVIFRFPLTERTLLLIPLALLTSLAGFAVGIWLAAIAVWLRDIKFMVGYILQVAMLLTPVGYSASTVPEKFHFLLGFNPASALIEGFRWSLVGAAPPSLSWMICGGCVFVVLLVLGIRFFASLERSFADVL